MRKQASSHSLFSERGLMSPGLDALWFQRFKNVNLQFSAVAGTGPFLAVLKEEPFLRVKPLFISDFFLLSYFSDFLLIHQILVSNTLEFPVFFQSP